MFLFNILNINTSAECSTLHLVLHMLGNNADAND